MESEFDVIAFALAHEVNVIIHSPESTASRYRCHIGDTRTTNHERQLHIIRVKRNTSYFSIKHESGIDNLHLTEEDIDKLTGDEDPGVTTHSAVDSKHHSPEDADQNTHMVLKEVSYLVKRKLPGEIESCSSTYKRAKTSDLIEPATGKTSRDNYVKNGIIIITHTFVRIPHRKSEKHRFFCISVCYFDFSVCHSDKRV